MDLSMRMMDGIGKQEQPCGSYVAFSDAYVFVISSMRLRMRKRVGFYWLACLSSLRPLKIL